MCAPEFFRLIDAFIEKTRKNSAKLLKMPHSWPHQKTWKCYPPENQFFKTQLLHEKASFGFRSSRDPFGGSPEGSPRVPKLPFGRQMARVFSMRVAPEASQNERLIEKTQPNSTKLLKSTLSSRKLEQAQLNCSRWLLVSRKLVRQSLGFAVWMCAPEFFRLIDALQVLNPGLEIRVPGCSRHPLGKMICAVAHQP